MKTAGYSAGYMAVLLDTNILLRSAQPAHPQFSLTKHAIAVLRREREGISVAIQNIVEFWVVATRPEKYNGFRMSVERAAREIAVIKDRFEILFEGVIVLPAWEGLVTSRGVSGKNAHDARLVAAMVVNQVDKILTFNTRDFMRFRGIRVLDPQSFV